MTGAPNRSHERDGGPPPALGRTPFVKQPAAAEGKSGLTRRGLVYEYIRSHPGVHVRAIGNELGFGTGDTQYHLFWLEKHGHVETSKSGFYRFVYPSRVFSEGQKTLLGILSLETPREILLSLLENAGLTQGDLAKRLGHSQPTISWHTDRLIRLGVVCERRTSRGVAYDLVADQGELQRFVKEYHPAVWRRWASRLPAEMRSTGIANAGRMEVPRVGLVQPALVKLIERG